MKKNIIVIGGGLAGSEAAYQIASRGIHVDLYEMRPKRMTEAHKTDFLAEMICSNSLGSKEIISASGLLKEELKRLDSFVIRTAEKFSVPAGNSLSVDRIKLAENISQLLLSMPNVSIIREEQTEVPETNLPVIIATGPLTSPEFARSISRLTSRKNLFFYDATTPIINADSIDFSQFFTASRYGKGPADFYNIPMDKEAYETLVENMKHAEVVELKKFEKDIFFEACLPIEEIAKRGRETLAYGPLRPVGLIDPKTEERPYAVVQLRQDDANKQFFQMVGFQTRLKWSEQKRIFRMLPGLKNAEFERYGRIHKNTYINAPLILNKYYQAKMKENIFFCGQISGVEGYVESISSGLIAGLFAAKTFSRETISSPPITTANGALIHYINNANWKDFKPTKFSFGLLPDLGIKEKNKKLKKKLKAERALEDLSTWMNKAGV